MEWVAQLPGVVPVDDLNSVTKLFSYAFGVLITGILGLAKVFWSTTKRTQKDIMNQRDDCQERHESQSKEFTKMNREFGELKGRVETLSSMKQLHDDVLSIVTSGRGKGNRDGRSPDV